MAGHFRRAALTARERARYQRWWIDQSGLSISDLVNLATGVGGEPGYGLALKAELRDVSTTLPRREIPRLAKSASAAFRRARRETARRPGLRGTDDERHSALPEASSDQLVVCGWRHATRREHRSEQTRIRARGRCHRSRLSARSIRLPRRSAEGARPAGARTRGTRKVVPHGHDRHEADEADDDDRRFDDADSDVSECDGFVHPPEDREEDDAGRRTADREQNFENAPDATRVSAPSPRM